MKANEAALNTPDSFYQLFKAVTKGFFSNFFKNTFKAAFATALALSIPIVVSIIESSLDLPDKLLAMIREFSISPTNLIKGCLLSSALVLTFISFIEKAWFIGIFKSFFSFISQAFGYLNIVKNTSSTGFSWGLASGLLIGSFLENPLLGLTVAFSGFLASLVPESSGMVFFARFLWNRVFKVSEFKSGVKPADEFIRGTAPGLAIAIFLKAAEATSDIYSGLAGLIFIFFVIGFIRQRKAGKYE